MQVHSDCPIINDILRVGRTSYIFIRREHTPYELREDADLGCDCAIPGRKTGRKRHISDAAFFNVDPWSYKEVNTASSNLNQLHRVHLGELNLSDVIGRGGLGHGVYLEQLKFQQLGT